jgi:hypothetical protein
MLDVRCQVLDAVASIGAIYIAKSPIHQSASRILTGQKLQVRKIDIK